MKAVRGGGIEERGRVLWDATSRGLCGRVVDHRRDHAHIMRERCAAVCCFFEPAHQSLSFFVYYEVLFPVGIRTGFIPKGIKPVRMMNPFLEPIFGSMGPSIEALKG